MRARGRSPRRNVASRVTAMLFAGRLPYLTSRTSTKRTLRIFFVQITSPQVDHAVWIYFARLLAIPLQAHRQWVTRALESAFNFTQGHWQCVDSLIALSSAIPSALTFVVAGMRQFLETQLPLKCGRFRHKMQSSIQSQQ